jgi:DNA (cytosine-5)-methyltransferase 1
MKPLKSESFARKKERLARGEKARVLDICGGAGGFSLGFLRAGFKLVGSIEADPTAAATYAANLHKEELTAHLRKQLAKSRDLTELRPSALASSLHLGKVSEAVDVLLAGLPCQAFARIGRPKLGSLAEDPAAYKRDPRASLYRKFLKYVRSLKPLCVVLENVPDILNHGGHNVPEEICGTLEGWGYICRYTLLNAASYGVPQLRERLFLVAYHRCLDATPEFPAPTHHVEFPRGYKVARLFALKKVDQSSKHYVVSPPAQGAKPAAVSVAEALGDLPKLSRLAWRVTQAAPARNIRDKVRYGVEASVFGTLMRSWPGFSTCGEVDGHIVRHTPRDYRHFARMQHGEQYPEMYKRAFQRFAQAIARRHRAGSAIHPNSKLWREIKAAIVPPYDPTKFPNKWRKLEPDKPSCTVTAHLGKDTYSHIHYDSFQARTISVREAARLQSFPDGFVFEGAMNAAFRQIGNAVPPLLAHAIALNVARALRPAHNAGDIAQAAE